MASSACLRASMSALVPVMRLARPFGRRSVTMPCDWIHFQRPCAVRTRCSTRYSGRSPLKAAKAAAVIPGRSSGCTSAVSDAIGTTMSRRSVPRIVAPVLAEEDAAGLDVEVPQRQLRAAQRQAEALADGGQLLLGDLARRDVAEDAARHERRAFLDVGADVALEHHTAPVLAEHRDVEGADLLAANQAQQQPLDDGGVFGRDDVEEVQVLEVVVGVAEQALPRRVHLHEPAERVHALQQVGAVVEDGAEARLALAGLRFEPAAHDDLAAQLGGAVLHFHRHGDAQAGLGEHEQPGEERRGARHRRASAGRRASRRAAGRVAPAPGRDATRARRTRPAG